MDLVATMVALCCGPHVAIAQVTMLCRECQLDADMAEKVRLHHEQRSLFFLQVLFRVGWIICLFCSTCMVIVHDLTTCLWMSGKNGSAHNLTTYCIISYLHIMITGDMSCLLSPGTATHRPTCLEPPWRSWCWIAREPTWCIRVAKSG